MKKVAVVVPTIREASIQRFLSEWKSEFEVDDSVRLFIVEDNPQKSFSLNGKNIEHLSWEDINRELGDKSWIIPRRTDCVRSFGFYRAYLWGADLVISIDDDCYPAEQTPYLIESYRKYLSLEVGTGWYNTMNDLMVPQTLLYPRGYPYNHRSSRVTLCHGLWDNVPDFDGKTQFSLSDVRVQMARSFPSIIPRNVFFPMCGMNVAVRREVLPAFWFLLMGQDNKGNSWDMHRFGDIWCGVFAKKIIDHLDHAALSGRPVIHHDRASDLNKNALLEESGLGINEWLHKAVSVIELKEKEYKSCYRELAEKLPSGHSYIEKLKQAMILWTELF